MLHPVNDSDFAKKVEEANGYVIVDFWGEGCGPCVQLAPVLEEVAKDTKDVKFYKMNVYENPEKPSALRIRGIPTLIMFKDGKAVSTKVGFMNKAMLEEWIKSESA